MNSHDGMIPAIDEDPLASQAQILRSTSIIGSATLVSMLMGLVRGKVAALLLGPAGLGMIGILTNLMAASANIAALGIGTSGVRHIAEAAGAGDRQAIANARSAMLIGMGALAVVGAGVVWAARDLLARLVLGDASLTGAVGWLAIGVGLLVASGSQGAILNGLRRTSDIALVAIVSAVLATIVGTALLLAYGERAIIAFVLVPPLVSFLVGHYLVSRLRLAPATASLADCARACAGLSKLGFAFLFSSALLGVGLLIVRARIQGTLGAAPLGLFEAAWSISMAYLGAVMAAMGTDFYPRLTAVVDDPARAKALVNEQTRVALWLCGPLCIGVIGFAPLATTLLFSSEFRESADLLRMLVLGDILKIVSWPLGFVLLAAGDGRRYVLGEAAGVLLLVGVPFLLLPTIGLKSVGIGYLLLYVLYLPLVHFWARRRIGFRWDRDVSRGAGLLMALALVTFAAATWSDGAGMTVGGVLMVLLSFSTLRHLARLAPDGSRIGRIAVFARRILGLGGLHG